MSNTIRLSDREDQGQRVYLGVHSTCKYPSSIVPSIGLKILPWERAILLQSVDLFTVPRIINAKKKIQSNRIIIMQMDKRSLTIKILIALIIKHVTPSLLTYHKIQEIRTLTKSDKVSWKVAFLSSLCSTPHAAKCIGGITPYKVYIQKNQISVLLALRHIFSLPNSNSAHKRSFLIAAPNVKGTRESLFHNEVLLQFLLEIEGTITMM